MCSEEGWRCLPLLVVPKALGYLLRHAAPQLAVVALHPRIGAQRLEQRDQRAARAVLVLSHGDEAAARVRFSSRSFPAIAISRAPTRSNAGSQRDTRAIARLDAGVWSARVQSRIEIARRRCVEGAPPSVVEAVLDDTFWKAFWEQTF